MTSPLAEALADAGADVVGQLLAAHAPDGRGRCRTCRKDGHPPTYPCALADAAAAAGRLLAERAQ